MALLKIFQINSAVSLNGSKGQSIDLGVHFEACMVDPKTCGAAGGAISMWMRVFGPQGGILTTITHQTEYINAGGIGIWYVFNKLA